MAGGDLRTVAELLRLQMVMRYSHLAPEHQASAVQRLVKTGKRDGHPNRTPGVNGESVQTYSDLKYLIYRLLQSGEVAEPG